MNDLETLIFIHENRRDLAEVIILSSIIGLETKFSIRQLSIITGLPVSKIKAVVTKSDKTGGKLVPDTLRDILHIKNSYNQWDKIDEQAICRVIKQGTSQTMLAKLTGLSQSYISQIWRKYA